MLAVLDQIKCSTKRKCCLRKREGWFQFSLIWVILQWKITEANFWVRLQLYWKYCCCLVAKVSFDTLWTVGCQLLCSWDFPSKVGLSCHFLLQGIFRTQGLNPYLLHWKVDSLPLNHLGRTWNVNFMQINYRDKGYLAIFLLSLSFPYYHCLL